MSRFQVCGALAILTVTVGSARSETVTKMFSDVNNEIPEVQPSAVSSAESRSLPGPALVSDSGSGQPVAALTPTGTDTDLRTYRSLLTANDGGSLTGLWAPDGSTVNPDSISSPASRTGLLGSLNGIKPLGDSTLFLADVDFGQEGKFVNWGALVTTIPEPSAFALAGVAGLLLAIRRSRGRAGRMAHGPIPF